MGNIWTDICIDIFGVVLIMNPVIMYFVVGFILFILFVVSIFALAYWLKKRRVKKSKKLFCEIFLKKGGRDIVIKSIDDDYFTLKKNGIVKRYLIIKEAIQNEYVSKITGPVINKFIQFDENYALPFIIGLIEKKGENKSDAKKLFLGAEKLEQMLNTRIWEQVGGIGKSNVPMQGIIIGAVVMVGIIIAIIFLRK